MLVLRYRLTINSGVPHQSTGFNPNKRPKPNVPVVTRYGPPHPMPSPYTANVHQYGMSAMRAGGLSAPSSYPTHQQFQQYQQFSPGMGLPPPPQEHYHPYTHHGAPAPATLYDAQPPYPTQIPHFPPQGLYPPPTGFDTTSHTSPVPIASGPLARVSRPDNVVPQHGRQQSDGQQQAWLQSERQTASVRSPQRSHSAWSHASDHSETTLGSLADLDYDGGESDVEAGDPPDQVARALPSSHLDPEAYDDYPPYREEAGISVSQYIKHEDYGGSCRAVRDWPDWAERKDDPVFRCIEDDCNMIPLSELRNLRERYARSEYSASVYDDGNIDDRDRRRRSDDSRSDTESMTGGSWDGSETERRNTSCPPVASRISMSPDTAITQEDKHPTSLPIENTEDVLARLGVTGAPKPVAVAALISRPGLPRIRPTAVDGRTPVPRSGNTVNGEGSLKRKAIPMRQAAAQPAKRKASQSQVAEAFR